MTYKITNDICLITFFHRFKPKINRTQPRDAVLIFPFQKRRSIEMSFSIQKSSKTIKNDKNYFTKFYFWKRGQKCHFSSKFQMSHFEHPSYVIVKIDFDYWTKNKISHESDVHSCNKSNLHEDGLIYSFLTSHNLVFVKMWIALTTFTLNLNF